MLCFLVGFALLFWPLVDGGPQQALKLSGSSFFTFGVVSSPQGDPMIVEFIAAATGMIVVALQMGYLPPLHGAQPPRNARGLTQRPGAWGTELLARHQLNNAVATMPPLSAKWKVWAADITELHVSHPWLIAFRSTDPLQSWIVSLMAVLDSAALWIRLAPSTAPPEARHIRLPFPSFLRGVEIITAAGFPTEAAGAEAWDLFSRWRVRYEVSALAIADFPVAVPAP